MCGRYYLNCDILTMLNFDGNEFEIADESGFDNFSGKYVCEIKPGVMAPAIILGKDRLHTKKMKWGFSGKGSELVINARSETMHQKPMFSALASGGRCILPASGYYEWRKGDGQKYNISILNADAFYLAGLCRIIDGSWQFVVLTQQPTEELSRIHHRMPLVLKNKKNALAWLAGNNIECEPFEFYIRTAGHEQLMMNFD